MTNNSSTQLVFVNFIRKCKLELSLIFAMPLGFWSIWKLQLNSTNLNIKSTDWKMVRIEGKTIRANTELTEEQIKRDSLICTQEPENKLISWLDPKNLPEQIHVVLKIPPFNNNESSLLALSKNPNSEDQSKSIEQKTEIIDIWEAKIDNMSKWIIAWIFITQLIDTLFWPFSNSCSI